LISIWESWYPGTDENDPDAPFFPSAVKVFTESSTSVGVSGRVLPIRVEGRDHTITTCEINAEVMIGCMPLNPPFPKGDVPLVGISRCIAGTLPPVKEENILVYGIGAMG
jgi:hypothetical protein